jgi:hypothetical protein
MPALLLYWVFIVVRVRCNLYLLMKGQCICINLCFRLGKLHWECITHNSYSFWWQCHVKNTDLWMGVSIPNWKLWLKIVPFLRSVNSEGGLNKACKVCAMVSHQSADPVQTFGHYKHGCGPLISSLAWFSSLWLFLISKSKITDMMAPLPVLQFRNNR